MKNTVSVILNILSIASAVILAVLGGFCIFDIIYYSSTVFAGSIDFWLAMRFYPSYLFAFSFSGIVTTITNLIILPKEHSKTFKFILLAFFVIVLVCAAVLQYSSHNF